MNGTPLSHVVSKKLVHTSKAYNKLNGYNNIDEEMIGRSPLVVVGTFVITASLEANGPSIESHLTDRATVLGKLNSIFTYSTAWTYYKVSESQHNGRKGYLKLHDHYLAPNNVDHMASTSEKIHQNAVYYGEQKIYLLKVC